MMRILVLLTAISLAGCAGVPLLSDDRVPSGGRFTIVLEHSGNFQAEHVGVTASELVEHEVPLDHGILEHVRDEVLRVLADCDACEYVAVGATHIVPLPDAKMRIFPLSTHPPLVIEDSPDGGAARRALVESLPALAEEHALDFIIVLSEFIAPDSISYTYEPLRGFGVHLRSRYGNRVHVAPYGVYHFYLRDTETGRRRSVSGVVHKKLPISRWMTLDADSPPETESLTPFVDDIKTAFSEDNAIRRALCTFGLLPVPQDSYGTALVRRCARAYP